MRTIYSSILFKYLIALTSLGGVTLSLICYKNDGYSYLFSRLLYFTGQSNIWIGGVSLVLATLLFLKSRGIKNIAIDGIYVLKYIFTVSIAATCIIYCFLLSPFADESYNVWSLGSILTHLISPVLAVTDFFLDDYSSLLQKRHMFFSLIPPVCYIAVASTLCLIRLDFGRGEPYPYFFMNYFSSAGLFGFSDELYMPIGSMYWIIIFAVLILGIAVAFYFLKTIKTRRRVRA